ncbi:hypothetical protein PLESTF_000431700 [Pleodorina starrii]|nr:hypothetical protein PLESTM_001920800 [Pleodorina starrii]GLC66476.1 hypothetical protein PLESTF_000431700 [Pleodorina starrii]
MLTVQTACPLVAGARRRGPLLRPGASRRAGPLRPLRPLPATRRNSTPAGDQGHIQDQGSEGSGSAEGGDVSGPTPRTERSPPSSSSSSGGTFPDSSDRDIRTSLRDSVHPVPSGMPVTELPPTREGVAAPTDPPTMPTPLSHSAEAEAEAAAAVHGGSSGGGGGGEAHGSGEMEMRSRGSADNTSHGEASRNAM